MLVLGLAVRSTHQARPPERHKQQNRERFSPAVAALPPESPAARFDGRWSCGGCGSRCWCWGWRCDPHTKRDLLSATHNKIASGFRLLSRPCLPSRWLRVSTAVGAAGGAVLGAEVGAGAGAGWWAGWWALW